MGRARYADVVTDNLGRPVAGTVVDVFATGTTTPVAGPVYAAATGATTLANPFTTGTTGEVVFYLADPARVDLRYTKSGYTSETHTVDVLDAEHAHSGTYAPVAHTHSGAYVAADAFRFTKPYAPAQAVLANTRTGRSSQTLVCLSDSTANTADEWFDLVGDWLVAQMPAKASALVCFFDDATQLYLAPTILKTTDGTGQVVLTDTFDRADGAAGEASGSTSGAQTWSTGTVASNKFVPTGTAATINTFAHDLTGSVKITTPSSGDMRLYLHADDPANNAFFIQVTLTAINIYRVIGAANTLLGTVAHTLVAGNEYTMTFSCMGPRVSATIGANTATGIAPIANYATVGPTDTYLGLRGDGALGGRFDDLTLRVNPTLILLNGSVGGQNLAYHHDATRFPKLVPWAPALVFVSHSHNQGTALVTTEYDSLVTKIGATYANTPIVFSTQNPETTNRAEAWHEQVHAQRQPMIRTLAAKNGHGLIDAYARFITDYPDPADSVAVNIDGTHPNPVGSALWAMEARRLFGDASVAA